PTYVLLTVSHGGYAKVQPLSVYGTQRRGGHGKIALTTKDGDYVEHVHVVHNHSTLLCFSNKGRVYWLPVYNIPEESRNSRGKPLVNMIEIHSDERITAIVPVPEEIENRFVCMATAKGLIKRTKLDEFATPRRLGKIAISLQEEDELIGVHITDGYQELMLVQSAGYAVRFKESDVRAIGRAARGVRGMNLRGKERVLAFVVPQPDSYLLCASEYGFGKCTEFSNFRCMSRNTRGVYALKPSERNGQLTCAVQVYSTDEVMFINDRGVLLRTAVSQIAKSGRMAIGVKLIDLKEGVRLVGVAVIHEDALAHFEDDIPTIDEDSTDTSDSEEDESSELESDFGEDS
ncbi:MAG: DNA gyrase subunit A, partial [Gammaproteobacteria bacterium]|nr:DNA gyrase subunit A [Gammaproteobacteria bacterium]